MSSVTAPSLSEWLVIADDAAIAARLSCLLATPKTYLPIIDGPRLQRPDRDHEVVRRLHAATRSGARRILLAGLEHDSAEALARKLPRGSFRQISATDDIDGLANNQLSSRPPLIWVRERIGIGLLRALRERRRIEFQNQSSPPGDVAPRSSHFVICEEGDDFAQIISANYAYALNAGLRIIPETPRENADDFMERFYSLYDRQGSPTEALSRLQGELRSKVGELPLPNGCSLTFVSDTLPFGFGFPEVPSTHLFRYPDLGISVINGFAAEQPGTRGVQVAVFVNPEETPAPEIDVAVKILSEQRVFVRGYQGPGADVTSITQMLEHFPYDLLVIATHCGDVSGYRWTYEFRDAENIPRVLVVDIALGIGRTADEDLLHVTQFMRFVSLDGVDWNDSEGKSKHYVGTAISDFLDRTRETPAQGGLEPTVRETVAALLVQQR